MTRIATAIVGFAVLIGGGVTRAEAASPANPEIRSIGNKLTVAVYRQEVRASRSHSVQDSIVLRMTSHETRHIGNKLTIDVSRR
jgi:hypothetical protein